MSEAGEPTDSPGAALESESPATHGRSRGSSARLDWFRAIAMPLVTLLVGGAITYAVDARQEKDNQVRFYADMMGRREDSDTSLRKDMFQSVLNTFLKDDPHISDAERIDQRILNLELLAYNFHDSIDLGPLFKDVRRQIPPGTSASNEMRRHRLEKVALEVNEREITILADSGALQREGVGGDDLAALQTRTATVIPFISATNGKGTTETVGAAPWPRQCLQMKSNALGSGRSSRGRQFHLEVIDSDPRTHELRVRLYVSRPLEMDQCRNLALDPVAIREVDINFWVNLFSFPMIDNTRLSNNERCAVVMTELNEDVAQLALVFFPGSRASLKDRPYYDEILQEMVAPSAATRP